MSSFRIITHLVRWCSLVLLPLLTSCSSGDWRTASRESAGIAPDPKVVHTALYQVYVAKAFGWRGHFATHPWVAWKRKGEEHYTTAHVVGWKSRRGGAVIDMKHDIPDRFWFGNRPELILQIEGKEAERAIDRTLELIQSYPSKDLYRLWPGPNSNTFVAYLIRNTPELNLELPPHAIGKDWPVDFYFAAKSPSGTGVQLSLLGILGLTLGLGEGIEFNILRLNFGLDFWPPALKLPFIGRIGFNDRPI